MTHRPIRRTAVLLFAATLLPLALGAQSARSLRPMPLGLVTPDRAPASSSLLIVPVDGIDRERLRDTYTESRGRGRVHEAIDIHAPQGSPVLAVVPGRIVKLHSGARGGLSVYLLDDDGRTRYYYAHLDGYAEGLREGQRVERGQVIGFVGDTGNASPGDYHLHFSVAVLEETSRWWQGRNLNPYMLLRGDEE